MPSPFLITPPSGLSPQLGRLVAMMQYARRTTLDAVAGLTTGQLDHLHDSESNSIGALLAHIAAVEAWYQVRTFGATGDAPRHEAAGWDAALDLGERGRREIRGRELSYYVDTLADVRALTLSAFAHLDDRWLETRVDFAGHESNHHFLWFHVMEDELSHRGQIRWLRKHMRVV